MRDAPGSRRPLRLPPSSRCPMPWWAPSRSSASTASHRLRAERVHHGDLWIAATTVHIHAQLVTADRVFDDVPGLQLAWSQPPATTSRAAAPSPLGPLSGWDEVDGLILAGRKGPVQQVPVPVQNGHHRGV